MSISSSPGGRPHNLRHISSPSRKPTLSPLLSASALNLSDFYSSNRKGSLEARSGRRGLSLEEVEEYGLIDTVEHSRYFDGIPISEEEIKKLPKKVCPLHFSSCWFGKSS